MQNLSQLIRDTTESEKQVKFKFTLSGDINSRFTDNGQTASSFSATA
jgi:hypothetical protein